MKKISYSFKSRGFLRSAVLLLFLTLVGLFGFTDHTGNDAEYNGENALLIPADCTGCEPRMGTAPAPTNVEQSDTIVKLHKARRSGDITAVRTLEEKRSKNPDQGEAAGPMLRRKSASYGGFGDPRKDKHAKKDETPSDLLLQGPEESLSTDIHVRIFNYGTEEINQSMTSDAMGNLYVAFQTNLSITGDYYIQVYWSCDGGQTWDAYGYVSNSSAHLRQPSIAIGEGSRNTLLLAYIVDDGVNNPYPEVATTPLGQNSFTMHSIPYWSWWDGYATPVIWTDSYDWNNWYAYLTCEGIYDEPTNNINVIFWRSTDFGDTWDNGQVVFGNTDPFAWRDADGSYGTSFKRVFLATYNDDDNTLYTVSSDDFGIRFNPQVKIFTMPGEPIHSVEPDIEAAVSNNNVMLACTRSFNGNDNIGQTYSMDAGQTWSSLWNVEGYTTAHEFAPDLTANEGGGSWHLTYTSNHHVYYTYRPQDLSDPWQTTPDVVDDAGWASHDYPKKGIASNWSTDRAGIAWADYRDGYPDYDTYFDSAPNFSGTYCTQIEDKGRFDLVISQIGESVTFSLIEVFSTVLEGTGTVIGRTMTLQGSFSEGGEVIEVIFVITFAYDGSFAGTYTTSENPPEQGSFDGQSGSCGCGAGAENPPGDISMITPYVNESEMGPILEAYSSDDSAPWGSEHRGIDFFPNQNLTAFQAVSSGVVSHVTLHNISNEENMPAHWQVDVTIVYNSDYAVEYVFEPFSSLEEDGEIQLANIFVSECQEVFQGDTIGLLYMVGQEAHVHFSLLKNTENICPEPYFTLDARESIMNLIRANDQNWNMCY